jgi:tetratricopeptide (TPR) repeat protein
MKIAVAGLLILACVSFSAEGQTPGCGAMPSHFKKLIARDELNKGVKAFKSTHYDEALCHFQNATELDSKLLIAKQYLGVAVAQKVVPDLDTPENLKIAQQALDIFQEVLAQDPHDVNSMKQIAGIDFSIKRLEEAKAWQKKVLAESPKDPEAAYTVGVIDWMEANQNVQAALVPVGWNDDGEGNAGVPVGVMAKINAQNGALVGEGLEYLNQALENRPNYDDAMVYLNLMYRRKADLDWGNETARKEDVAKANEWTQKAMAARKANEKKNAGAGSAKP